MTNPLLTDWATPFGLPPFADVSDDDFAPAVDAALETARANITEIAENAEAATFDNTVVAWELADAQLGRVLGAFYALAGADSNAAREGLQRDFAPQLSGYGSWITANTVLFARVEDLWARRDCLELTDEQARVLMLTRRGFVRAGAQLTGAEADRLRDVKSRLSVLGTQFVQTLSLRLKRVSQTFFSVIFRFSKAISRGDLIWAQVRLFVSRRASFSGSFSSFR